MRPLQVSEREARILDLMCEFGQTDLVAYKLQVKPRSVDDYISRIIRKNKYPNRLTLVLAWDRQNRCKLHPPCYVDTK